MYVPCNRRWFIGRGLAVAALPVLASCAHHGPAPRIPRIGYLSGATFPTMIAAFHNELRRLGYIDGHNIVIEQRLSRPNSTDGAGHAAELAAMDLDLIVVAALPIAIEVRRHNPRMPMVIATGPGLIGNGFARSFERPGGITTGMDELPPGLTGRRLTLLKTAAPSIRRVALLSTTPGFGGHETQVADARSAAARLGIEVNPYRVTSLAELEPALSAMVRDRVDGVVNFQGALSLVNRDRIIDFARDRRVPAIYQSRLFAESGGLLSYSPDQEEQFRIAARMTDKILRGTKPGDVPIQHPERYFLTVNLAAASAIGLTIPATLLAQADSIIR